MRDSAVGLETRLEVDHFLVGFDRFCQPPLLHERVAQQRIIEGKFPPRHEMTRDFFRFAEAMERFVNMSAEQGGIRALWHPRFDRRRALFREFVKARVVRAAGRVYVSPAEAFQECGPISGGPYFILEINDFAFDRRVTGEEESE